MNDYKKLILYSKTFLERKGQKNVILIRSCENLGSLSGSLNGWLDVKLSEYGRRQAKHLSLEFFNSIPAKMFEKVYNSDLKRAKETADICFAFENIKRQENQLLREIFFGKNEGLFYDGLSKEKKAEINNPMYIAPMGECWLDIKYRSAKFIRQLKEDREGNYVIFSHAAFISSCLSAMNNSCKETIPHGTMIFLTISQKPNDILSLFDDYQEKIYKYHTKERIISIDDYNKYFSFFNDYLRSNIDEINYKFIIPTLEEEF